MTLKSRIATLERRAGVSHTSWPEIVVHSGVSRDASGELVSCPGFAVFIGFPKEELIALDGETNEQFSARAENHLAELKRAKSIIEQKGA